MKTFKQTKTTYTKTAQELEKIGARLKELTAEHRRITAEFANGGYFVSERNTTAERVAEYHRLTADIDAEFDPLAEREQLLTLVHRVEYDNMRRAFVAEFLPVFVEVWNSYKGKRYGEKTRAKISDEIKAKTGARAYVTGDSYHDTLTFYTDDYTFRYDGLTLTTYHGGNAPHYLIAGDNQVQEITAETLEALKLSNCPEYADNPTKRAKDIIKAHKAMTKARAELEKAITAYNGVKPSSLGHTYMRIENDRLN